jgi:hypothetical protein
LVVAAYLPSTAPVVNEEAKGIKGIVICSLSVVRCQLSVARAGSRSRKRTALATC